MTAIEDHPMTASLAAPDAFVISTAPPGTPEWHQTRQGGVGGSDVADVLGLNPKYGSPLKTYLGKRGELPDLPRSQELEEYAEFGHEMEELIRRRWAKRTGLSYVPAPGTHANKTAPWMRVNLDAIAVEDGEPGVLEVKNRSEYQLKDWENDLPDAVALQVHWGMAVTGYTFGHAAAVIGGNKLRHYRIERDEELLAHLVELVKKFWDDTCMGVEPPVDNYEATRDLLGQLWKVEPEKVIYLPPEQIDPLLDRRAELKAAGKEIDAELLGVENAMKRLIGDAEIARFQGAEGTAFTWKQQKRTSLDSKRLRKERPTVAKEYERVTKARSLYVPAREDS